MKDSLIGRKGNSSQILHFLRIWFCNFGLKWKSMKIVLPVRNLTSLGFKTHCINMGDYILMILFKWHCVCCFTAWGGNRRSPLLCYLTHRRIFTMETRTLLQQPESRTGQCSSGIFNSALLRNQNFVLVFCKRVNLC